MDAIDAEIIKQALAAATVAKMAVDLMKMARPWPSWALPAFAVAIGFVLALAFRVAAGEIITAQVAAQSFIVGIMAGASAVAQTEIQKRASVVKLLRR